MDYEEFYSSHIKDFKRTNGANVQCKCPFHEDKKASMSVNIDSGLYNCFGCGESGNVVKFMEKIGIKPSSSERKRTVNKKAKPLSLKQVLKVQMQLSGDALTGFMRKYGLNVGIIGKFKIGYMNNKYIIPIRTEDGWMLKEHKGLQFKGLKATLYPHAPGKDEEDIYVTEGEFKALLLIQHGLNAVTNTAGASTWQDDWCKHFEGLNIYFIYDNDRAGRDGTLKAAGKLRQYASKIVMVQWPEWMKDKEDITDYIVTYKRKIKDLTFVNAYEYKEVAGEKFVEPEGYVVDRNKVSRKTMQHGTELHILIAHTGIFLTGRAVNVETGYEELEVTFLRDNQKKSLWISRRNLFDSRKVIELSEAGFPVSSNNAGRIIDYLMLYESVNLPFINKKVISNSIGWKVIDKKVIFLMNKEDNAVELSVEAGYERLLKAVESKGSYNLWVRAIGETLKKNPKVRFAIYASFAAPLLRLLKAPNFIVDFFGSTSTGKTTTLEIASSVWGNPYKEGGGLVLAWNSTKVFIERVASFFCDMPIFFDDSQTVEDKPLQNILYQVANGVGKGRGSIGGVRHTNYWHTVCFSTGERSISECTTYAGVQARTVSLYGSPFRESGKAINDIKSAIRANYGHAGQLFIKHLQSLVNDRKWREEMKKKYTKIQKELADEVQNGGEIADRYSHYFSVVMIAAGLAAEIVGDNWRSAELSIVELFSKVVSESRPNTDIGTSAMKYILSWACSNQNCFYSELSNNQIKELYGLWKEGDCIGIFPHKLTEVLQKEKYSKQFILRSWSERGWIAADKNHNTVLKRIEGNQRRLIVIPWDIVGKFL